MSYQISNFTDNDDIKTLDQQGPFSIIEYQRDLSVTPASALNAYYCSQMNVRKRQVVCDLSKADITTQAGAMQWMLGDVNATTGIKGVGDLLGKAVRGKVTGESAIKPEYRQRHFGAGAHLPASDSHGCRQLEWRRGAG